MKRLANWLKSPPKPRPRTRRPTLESLGDRITPVVGAFELAPVAETGMGLDGVVLVGTPDGSQGSGSLLQSGRHILTAAHVVDGNKDGKVDAGNFVVTFTTVSGTYSYNVTAANIVIAPGWNGNAAKGKDLALMTLPNLAPADADRYRANYTTGEVGQDFVVAGYGRVGTGDTGEQPNSGGSRTYGHNIFDARGWEADYGGPYQTKFGPYGTLAYDFDNRGESNPLGNVYFMDEGFAAKGDSGGPLFTDFDFAAGDLTWISGVVSYRVGNTWDDIDETSNSSFGEVAFATRVSDFATWINSRVGLGRYELVVDMARQPGGGNGQPDTIEARVEGLEAQIWVNGRLIQREALSRLSGLKILGTVDADTVTVSGAYRMPVSVDGRGGGDVLTVDDSGNTLPATVTVRPNKVNIRTTGITAQANVTFTNAGLAGLTVHAGHPVGKGNTVTVEDTPADPAGFTRTTIFTGVFNDTVNVRRVSSPTSIFGQAGTDTVNVGVGNSVANIRSSLGVTNDGGSTQLNVLASADPARNVVMASSPDYGNYISGLAPAPILYGHYGIRGVSVTTGAGADTFDIQYAQVPIVIKTGGNDDQVTVGSVNSNAPLSVDTGIGRNTVTIGGPEYGIPYLGSAVNVRATGGTNTLVLDDRGQEFATVNTLTGTSFVREGSSPITFADVYSLIVYGGHGVPTGWFAPPGNTYDVVNTPKASRLGASYTTIFTGEARDAVSVQGTTGHLYVDFQQGDLESLTVGGPARGLDLIKGPVTLFGAGGMGWNVTVDDSGSIAPRTVTIDRDGLQRSGAALISYAGVPDFPLVFLGGSGGNTIQVRDKPGNLTLLSGEGADTINVGSPDNRLSDLGHLVINGQGGIDLLNLNDQGDADMRTYDLFTYGDIPVVTAAGTTVVLYDQPPESVRVNGSQGGNTVNVQNLFPNIGLTLVGGSGANELSGPEGSNRWTLTGPDSGSLASDAVADTVVVFEGFPSWVDPEGDDVFE